MNKKQTYQSQQETSSKKACNILPADTNFIQNLEDKIANIIVKIKTSPDAEPLDYARLRFLAAKYKELTGGYYGRK